MEKDKKNNLLNSLLQKLSACFLWYKKLFPNFSANYGEDYQKRVLSSLIMIPVALYAILHSVNLFLFLSLLVTIIMTSEWLEITKSSTNQNKWRLIGLIYILIPVYSVINIRNYDGEIVLWMFSIIWVTDISAFFAGKYFGVKKLAPKISPNKTWAGAFGGIIASALIGGISVFMFRGSLIFFLSVSILLSIIEQVSDLTESKIKRIFGVKDSGNIIPGHGGVIDRLDGMILVAPAVLLIINLFPAQF